jgi:hypothetical protein
MVACFVLTIVRGDMKTQTKTGNLIRASIVIICFVGLLFLQYFALMKQSELGILPGGNMTGFYFSQPLFSIADTGEPIPVTSNSGVIDTSKLVRFDGFTADSNDWKAINARIWVSDYRLNISPLAFQKAGLVEWNVLNSSLPESFTYQANFFSTADANQKHGLAFNIAEDGSAILFLVNPSIKNYTLVQWANESLIPITDWKTSEAFSGTQNSTSLSIQCNNKEVSLNINGSLVETVMINNGCGQGKLGIFVLSPSWLIQVDNAALFYE